MYYPDDTDLTIRKTIPELVKEWDLAMSKLQGGLDMVKEAVGHLKAFHGPSSTFELEPFKYNEYSMDFNRKHERMKIGAWRYLVDRADLKKAMSIARRKEVDAMFKEPAKLPDITVDNLMNWIGSLPAQAETFMREACTEIFELLRPNTRHKTNDMFKIGRKVILVGALDLPYRNIPRQSIEVNRFCEDSLCVLNSVFHMLAGKGLGDTRKGELVDAINSKDNLGTGETTFFKFKCYLNGNLHLEFKDMDLVRKLNEIGGNALPQ